MSTAHQIKLIHTIKHAAGIVQEDYQALLSSYGVLSSTQLTPAQAVDFIKKLECIGIAAGAWKKKMRFDDLGPRPGMATPLQLRHLEGLWVKVSRQPTLKEKQASFNKFLQNRFQIARIEWIPIELVPKIKRALKAMEKQNDADC